MVHLMVNGKSHEVDVEPDTDARKLNPDTIMTTNRKAFLEIGRRRSRR